MSIWTKIAQFCTQNATRLVSVSIPVTQTDCNYDTNPAQADHAYLRIFMAEMMLTKERKWFKDWQPAVHALIRFAFAGQNIELARVGAPRKGDFLAGRSILSNYVLLDLIPFRGGTMELELALVAMKGTDHLDKAISVLAKFGDLAHIPISTGIALGQKVKECADLVFQQDGDVHLGYHNTFGGSGGSNTLTPGYYAVVLANPTELDHRKLAVKNDQLHINTDHGIQPFTGYDHMLFRIETCSTRDDLHQFRDIAEPRDLAIAAAQRGSKEDGRLLINSAITRASTHPELINADRRAVARRLQEDFFEATSGSGALSGLNRRDSGNGKSLSWADFVATISPGSDHSDVKIHEFEVGELPIIPLSP